MNPDKKHKADVFAWMFRADIDKGLQSLSKIRPAGETYMHEGLIKVSR